MLRFKVAVRCVDCGANMNLGFLDMLPNPRTALLVVPCEICHHRNRVPYYYSFFGLMLAVLISILVPAKSYGFVPDLLSGYVGVIGLGLIFISFFLASSYLVFHSYFGLCQKPFVAKDHKNIFFS